MKSFKNFIVEEVLDTYRNKKLITTKHYADRQSQRDSTHDVLKHTFRKLTDHLKHNEYDGDNQKFLVYSKKHNRAVVFSHQKDYSNPKDKRKHLIAVTVFPEGEKHASTGTKPLTVENYSPEFTNYVDTITNSKDISEPLVEVIVEGVELYYLHGKLDNIPFTEFLEVD